MHSGPLHRSLALIASICLTVAMAAVLPTAAAHRRPAAMPRMTPQLVDAHKVVNGCDPTLTNPPGPFGMCLDGLPHFYCCSSGEIGWSGVVAGSTIDIRGAVPIDPSTRRPQSSAVLIINPSGGRTEIPVAPTGAFARRVQFPSAGTYQIGVLYGARPANLQSFSVAWRYRILTGPTLAGVFGHADRPWGGSGNVYLTAPMGTTSTWTIVLENAGGVPQPRAALTPTGPFANDAGVVRLTFKAPEEFFGPPAELATGLFVQTYADIRPAGATLTGFPRSAHVPGLSAEVRSIVQGGITYYSVEDFLARMEVGWSGLNGPMSDFSYDPSTRELVLWNMNYGTEARIDTVTGAVQVLEPEVYPSAAVRWKYYATVRPIFSGGQTYLSLRGLVVIGNAVAWAEPDGHGGMLFSNSWII